MNISRTCLWRVLEKNFWEFSQNLEGNLTDIFRGASAGFTKTLKRFTGRIYKRIIQITFIWFSEGNFRGIPEREHILGEVGGASGGILKEESSESYRGIWGEITTGNLRRMLRVISEWTFGGGVLRWTSDWKKWKSPRIRRMKSFKKIMENFPRNFWGVFLKKCLENPHILYKRILGQIFGRLLVGFYSGNSSDKFCNIWLFQLQSLNESFEKFLE